MKVHLIGKSVNHFVKDYHKKTSFLNEKDIPYFVFQHYITTETKKYNGEKNDRKKIDCILFHPD